MYSRLNRFLIKPVRDFLTHSYKNEKKRQERNELVIMIIIIKKQNKFEILLLSNAFL